METLDIGRDHQSDARTVRQAKRLAAYDWRVRVAIRQHPVPPITSNEIRARAYNRPSETVKFTTQISSLHVSFDTANHAECLSTRSSTDCDFAHSWVGLY